MARPTQVSMQDVAKAAGVSPQTVSRVANDSNAVKPETRQRVEAAMERLGYRPNYAARALKHGRFQDIGVVMFDTTRFGNARILDSIVTHAAEDGYSVTIQTMSNGAERTLASAIDRMQRQPVDGVIVVLEERISDFVGYKPPRELPVVLISEAAADHCPTVDADQYGCSTAIVDYLMSKGHKTVYHIAGPVTSRAAESRAQGWREALEQIGARTEHVYRRLVCRLRLSGRRGAGSRPGMHRNLCGQRPDGLQCDARIGISRQARAGRRKHCGRGRFAGRRGAKTQPHHHAHAQ